MSNLQILVKEVMNEYIDKQEPFTGLQISNDLKEKGEKIRHRDISGIVRDVYNYHFSNVYLRTQIDVTAEIINDQDQLEEVETQALLYHPFNFDIDDYDTKELKAIKKDDSSPSIKADDSKDKEDEVEDAVEIEEITEVNGDGIRRYNLSDKDGEVIEDEDSKGKASFSFLCKVAKDFTATVYSTKLDLQGYEDGTEFNLLIYPKMIFFKKASKNGVVKLLESKGKKLLRVRKSLLDMSELSEEENVWIHLLEDQIIVNNFHPVVMSWEKYRGKVITFKADTPDSDSGIKEQTVVLKVDGFKVSKKGDALVYGRNLKRIDDEHSVDNVHRQYRFERVHADSVKEVTFV